MKRIILILSLLAAMVQPVVYAETQLVDRIVAVVNDEIITQSELDVYLRAIYAQYKTENEGEKLMELMTEARTKLLNQMIEDRLVFQKAKKEALEVPEEEVDKMFDEFKKRFKDDAEMNVMMKREGVTLTTVRDRLYRQAMIQKLQDMEIRSKVVISPNEIDEYYEAHPEEFIEEEQIKVRSITVKKSDEAREKGLTDEAAKEKIQNLRKMIVEGSDFAQLATANSEDTRSKDGGLSDWVRRGEMISVIDQVIFQIEKGKVSEIIETPMGYHIFRVEEKKEGKKHNLEEMRDAIFGRIFKKKAEERFNEWMRELKKEAYISIR